MAMFENISEFFKRFMQNDKKELLAENPSSQSKDMAKDRLHVVLMQDRANVSADFLELMKEEIIEVIKKYIVVDESKIDVRLTNEENEDGSIGAPLLHANIPILNVRNDLKGTYMNGAPSDKIEGQQEINMEDNKEEPEVEKKEEQNQSEQKELENEIVEDHSDVEEIDVESVEVETQPEESMEPEIEVKEDSITTEENNETETTVEVIETDDFDETDEELDDDVTFDDLLKAAEEEEERLKQLEGKRDKNDFRKRTAQKKKKKTSKMNENK